VIDYNVYEIYLGVVGIIIIVGIIIYYYNRDWGNSLFKIFPQCCIPKPTYKYLMPKLISYFKEKPIFIRIKNYRTDENKTSSFRITDKTIIHDILLVMIYPEKYGKDKELHQKNQLADMPDTTDAEKEAILEVLEGMHMALPDEVVKEIVENKNNWTRDLINQYGSKFRAHLLKIIR
jgi:hypothetical protein